MNKSQTVSLGASLIDSAVTIVKAIFAVTTGSTALLAETFHSGADSLASFGIWWSLRYERARKAMLMEKEEVDQLSSSRWGLEAEQVERAWSADRFRFYKEHIEKKLSVSIGLLFVSLAFVGFFRALRAPQPFAFQITSGIPIIVMGGLAGLSYLLGRFVYQVSTIEGVRDLATGSARAKADAVGSLLVAGVFFCRYFDIAGDGLDRTVGLIISVIIFLQGLEIIVSTVRAGFEDRRLADLEADPHAVGREMILSRLLSGSGWISLVGFVSAGFAMQTGPRRPLRFIQQHLPLVAVLTLALLWFQSAFVVVGPSDVVILERFGQAVNLPQPLGPGWHLKFPWPIDCQVVVPVAEVQEITVGYTKEFDDPYILWRIPHHETEYQLVTGDGSLVSVNMFIRYRIDNPRDWYLTARSPRAVLEAEAYRLLGQNIRTRSIFWVIGPNRQELAQMIKDQIQQVLNQQRLGLQVLQVNLLNAHPPTSLNPDENIAISYLEVFDSLQTRQKLLNEADLVAIQETNLKTAQAAGIIYDAQAQFSQTISKAQGRTDRFGLMIELLQKNPDYLPLIRSKLKLNYLREALGKETGKIVIDPQAVDKNVEIWLQYPRKPIPFIEEPPLLTPSNIGAKSTREK